MLKVALIAPPWLTLPPRMSGGVEAVIHSLAQNLSACELEVVLFSVGTSQTVAENRFLFPHEAAESHELHELNHLSWCLQNAGDADVIHLNSDLAIPLTRFMRQPFVHTLHHPVGPALLETLCNFPKLHYVAVSEFQKTEIEKRSLDVNVTSIHHGIDVLRYPFQQSKENYFCYLGRIAPEKGVEYAIAASRRCGVPLKIAGPSSWKGYQRTSENFEYFQRAIEPLIDGSVVQYLGELGFKDKVELLKNSRGLLFPAQWDEPFGLVMVEAMACGTPVFALRRGAVPEIVAHGKTGYVTDTPDDFDRSIRERDISPMVCREWVEQRFSSQRMASDYLSLYNRVLGEGAGYIPATCTNWQSPSATEPQ